MGVRSLEGVALSDSQHNAGVTETKDVDEQPKVTEQKSKAVCGNVEGDKQTRFDP